MPSIRRLAVLPAIVGALALLPAAASAETLCVSAPGCVGTGADDLNQAIDAADANSGATTIVLGPGTFNTAGKPLTGKLTLAGAGPSSVISWGDGTAVTATGESVTVRDVRIVAEGRTGEGALDVSGGAHVERVEVGLIVAQSANPNPATVSVDGGELVDVRVDAGTDGTGVRVAGPATLRRMTIAARHGVSVYPRTSTPEPKTPKVLIEDSRIEATEHGVYVLYGETRMLDTLVRLTGASGVALTAATITAPDGSGRSILARGLTLLTSTADARVADVLAGTDRPSRLELADSIIDPAFATLWYRRSDAADRADIVLDHVNHADAPNAGDTGAGAITETARVLGTPQFADPANGDFRLVTGSPLIDAGTSTSTGTDVAGRPRATDGDGDCAAARDLGAFETDTLANPACSPSASADPFPATPPAPSLPAGPAGPAAPAAATPPTPAADRTAPALSRLTSRRAGRALRGTVRVSEAARLTLQVVRASGRRVGGPVTVRAARAGTATWKLTLPKALRRGTYRVTVTATDTAGNRSRPVQATFRVR